MNKLKIWNGRLSWEEAEAVWDQGAKAAKEIRPIKDLKILPQMPGMTEETKSHLKWKSIKWMIAKDHGFKILKNFLRHPLKYGYGYVKSLLKKQPFVRDGDFFLYGISSLKEFEALLKDHEAIFIAGFSYCHKPFECPSGRFTSECIADPGHPVCRQCFIGKCVNALDERAIPLFIPTIHYIGNQVFDIVHANPGKRVLFLITACEMTLTMFGDFGNMAGIQGIGARLDGRICNNMRAFELSEQGIKPGLTVVLDETKNRILKLLSLRSSGTTCGKACGHSAHGEGAPS